MEMTHTGLSRSMDPGAIRAVGVLDRKSRRHGVHLWVGQIRRCPGVHPFLPQMWCFVPPNKGEFPGPGKIPGCFRGWTGLFQTWRKEIWQLGTVSQSSYLNKG